VFVVFVVRLEFADRNLMSDILEEIGHPPKDRGANEQNHYRQIMGLRAVHVMAFFSLIYVG